LSDSAITCNDMPLARETVSLPENSSSLTDALLQAKAEDADGDDDDFVYDVYRTDDDQFDFHLLENVLAIQALRFAHLLCIVLLCRPLLHCYAPPHRIL